MQDNFHPATGRAFYRSMKIYQMKASFRVRESIGKTYDEAVGAILEFISENKWVPLNGATGSFSVRDSCGEMECVEFKNGHLWAACLHFRKEDSSPGRFWTYELAVTETDDRLFFGIAVHMECVPGREENFTPQLIFRLEERIGFNELDGQPLCLNEVDVRQDLFNLVMSGERVLPIVAVAPLTGSRWDQNVQPRYLIDVSALASHLNGYARVIRFSRAIDSEWSYCAGIKWAVFDGSVRIINPRFDVEHRQLDHPLFTKDKIMYCESRDGNGSRIFFASLCSRIKRQIAEAEMNFSEVVFLREARRLRRIMEQILGVSPDSLNGAPLLPRELPGKLPEMQEALEEYRKLYGELPQKEPETPVVSVFSEMAQWCKDVLAGKLVLHPQAEAGLPEARYRNPELVCQALLLLAVDWRDSRLGLENKFNEKCNELGLEFLSSRRNGHLFTSGKDWFLEYPIGSGKTEFLQYQLRKGCAKTPLRCMRIYFWWDDAGKVVVVGHLPGYIEKGGS